MGTNSEMPPEQGDFATAGRRTVEVLHEIGNVVIGQADVVRQVLICLLARGRWWQAHGIAQVRRRVLGTVADAWRADQ